MTTAILLDLVRQELQSELGPRYSTALLLPWNDPRGYGIGIGLTGGPRIAIVLHSETDQTLRLLPDAPGVSGEEWETVVEVAFNDPEMFQKLARAACQTSMN